MNLIEFSNAAIDVPFLDHGSNLEGWDCWGLIVAAYRAIFNIEVRTYDYSCAEAGSINAEKINRHKEDEWLRVVDEDECPGDVILLRNGRLACHVGLVVEKGRMLHTQKVYGTCIERYNSPLWIKRIAGFYCHARRSADR